MLKNAIRELEFPGDHHRISLKFRGLWSISFALRVLSWTQILGGQILWSLWTDFVAERCAELPVAVVIAPVGEVLRTVRTSKRSLSGVDALVSL